ncbi:MAG: type II secretion system secretin GspD [Methylococcales bacterium]|nr:type II secretion system secretin GspD [Methylococcales bacterium]MBT7410276.1 type II secretion system secretin GspD [Methylococcales bacterium]
MNKLNPLAILLASLLAGCSTQSIQQSSSPIGSVLEEKTVTTEKLASQSENIPQENTQQVMSKTFTGGIYQGTGNFINKRAASSNKKRSTKGDVVLNFEDSDIRAVIKAILGDILNENYTIDANVKGTVTVKTQSEIPKSSVLPMLETVLRINGVVLVRDGGYFKAIPAKLASRSTLVPRLANKRQSSSGFGSRVFPLRYIAASEMSKIIAPLLPDEQSLKAIEGQNLLIASGTGPELNRISETVEIFDVDWLAGMSVAMFPVETTDAKTVAKELEELIIGDKSPISGMIRLIPVERLNSILVMSPQAAYLKQIQKWVKRLDQAQNDAGQRLYVYYVQNGKAATLAELLNGFLGGNKSNRETKARIAPGKKTVEINSSKKSVSVRSNQGEGIAYGSTDSIKVIADEVNNALLIMADPKGYRLVTDALSKLDITPLQVLVEVTIAEVVLNDALKYGLEMSFKNVHGRFNDLVKGSYLATNNGIGFTYTLEKSGSARGLIEALATKTNVKVLSSPSIMVLNNQSAKIEVGDEVPVLTQQQQSTTGSTTDSSTSPAIVNSIQYKKAGVILSVTPRVNSGGLVTMEVSQEVSDVVANNTSGIDSPKITQRKVETNVAVQSGQTVVLGGMIKDKTSKDNTGVPFLKDIPWLGHLFKSVDNGDERTELLVMIKPIVIDSTQKANDVTNEYKSRMKKVSRVQENRM